VPHTIRRVAVPGYLGITLARPIALAGGVLALRAPEGFQLVTEAGKLSPALIGLPG